MYISYERIAKLGQEKAIYIVTDYTTFFIMVTVALADVKFLAIVYILHHSTHSFSARFITKIIHTWSFKFPVWNRNKIQHACVKEAQSKRNHPAKQRKKFNSKMLNNSVIGITHN